MPTPKKGARLGGSASHQKKILSNLAAALFEHGAIKTTDAKAKMLRPYAEKLITKAKSGTLADRRAVLAQVPNKAVVAHLFDDLAPQFANREGGYTRSIKIENRSGDNAPMTMISLVLEEVEKKTRAPKAEQEAPAVEAEESTDAQAEAEAKDSDETTPVTEEEAQAVEEKAAAEEAASEEK